MIMGELGCSEHKVQVHTGEDGCNHQKYGVDDLARLGLGVFYAKDEIRDPYKVGHHRQPADANKQRKAEQHIDNAHAPLRKEHLLQLFHPAPPHFPFFQYITACINVQDRPAEHRLFDGPENILVARAPAQVPGQELAQLVVRVLHARVQNLRRGQNEARRAEAALNRRLVDKRLLDIRERPVGVHEPFEGDDVLALCPDGKIQT